LQVQIQRIFDIQYESVRFYTARVLSRPSSEFHDFLNRLQYRSQKDRQQLGQFLKFLKMLGTTGALENFFVPEGHASRLPEKNLHFRGSNGKDDYGLRLFCKRLNNDAVILLNGDRKTTYHAYDCPNCQAHYHFANDISIAIDRAESLGEIKIIGHDFFTPNNDNYQLSI
jgi:hypothetical protein